ncbi:MAG: hypothetical protein ACRC1M_04615 [Methanobacteriaceae archaeon]
MSDYIKAIFRNRPMSLDADALKLADIDLIKNNKDLIINPNLNKFKEFFNNQNNINTVIWALI